MNEITRSSPPDNPLAALCSVSVDLELALIGAALLNQQALDTAAPHVKADDFSDQFLGQLWAVMGEMHREGVKLTPMLVAARISSPATTAVIQETFRKTPIGLMAHMAAQATTVLNAPDYGKQVRELRNRRDLHAAAGKLLDGMADPGQSVPETASAMSAAVEKALNAGHKPRKGMATILTESLAALDGDQPAPGVSTGLSGLDKQMGGFVPGDLIVLGARPSMGKSALSLSATLSSAVLSYQAAQRQTAEPWACLFMTHEMTHEQCYQRMLTDLAMRWFSSNPVEYLRFRPTPGEAVTMLSQPQREAMHQAAGMLPRLPIVVDGYPGMTITEVTATIRQHKKRFAAKGLPLKVVAVDHIGMGKIQAVARAGAGPVQEIGEVTTSLKACAVNDELCILAAHQLSRANEGRENKRPTLADFRDSGHIEQDADVMIGLYRDMYYLERTKESDPGKEQIRKEQMELKQHEMEAHVLKVRMGRVGHVGLWAHMGANAIRNAGSYQDIK